MKYPSNLYRKGNRAVAIIFDKCYLLKSDEATAPCIM